MCPGSLICNRLFKFVMLKKLSLLIPLLILTGSDFYSEYSPILMNRSDLEKSVKMIGSSRTISEPGKIYLYKNWIFLVEKYKGIHFIDNSNPETPVLKDFLTVPGCMDVAVGKGILYVDSSVDLVGVSIDFSNMKSKEVSRAKGVLSEIVSPYGFINEKFTRRKRPENTEIVGWIKND